jgi:hypothetical protein
MMSPRGSRDYRERMSNATNEALLQRRLEELESENTRLRLHAETLHAETLPSRDPDAPGPRPSVSGRTRRRAGWTLLATLLIVIGAILAPAAVVASWAKLVLTDTDRFVATYAPLVDDPDIQSYLTDETLTVINQQVDVPELTSDAIDGMISLGTGPAATDALNLLKGPAASGIQSLIQSGVSNFVSSEAFADVWATALRVSHTQFVALMENDSDGVVTIGDDGTIGIQLGPIVEAVKTALLAQGIELASQLPAVDRTLVVAQSDALPSIQVTYALAVAAGVWLPWIALLFLAAGVLVARRRSVALIWAAVALAVAMLLTLAAVAVGNLLIVSSVGPGVLPSDVATLLYDSLSDDVRITSIAVLVLAVVVAAVAWLAGPFTVPRRMRGLARDWAGHLRRAAERRGITTGRVGRWIYSQRVLLHVFVAVIAAMVVLFVRPLTPALTIWTLVIATIVIGLLEVLQRPLDAPASPAPVTAPPAPGQNTIREPETSMRA